MNERSNSEFNERIDLTYAEFDRDFNADNFPAVFKWIEEFNAAGKYGKSGHPLLLSPPPIFQTPVYENPKLMVVADKNSWFDRKNSQRAERNLKELAGRKPTENSYTEHDGEFGRKLRKVFGPDNGNFIGVGKLSALSRCVGINRLWIQVGAEDKPGAVTKDIENASKERSLILGESFKDYCESRTRSLIQVIQPEILALVGSKAQRLYAKVDMPEGIKVIDAPYPSRGGEQKMADTLRDYF